LSNTFDPKAGVNRYKAELRVTMRKLYLARKAHRKAQRPLVASKTARSREPRARRTTTARTSRGSPARDDDPEPLAPRRCRGCNEVFTPADPRRNYHSETCRNAAKQRRHKARLPDGSISVGERDQIAKAPTRVPMREATRLVKTGRLFEVSRFPGELGFDARPLDVKLQFLRERGQTSGRLHWPFSKVMRELKVETHDLAFPDLVLERLMQGADTDDRYWEQVTA
jgi:hypothetical protein